MSQKKVDEYKKQKANRKKMIKKEKRKELLMKITGVVITAAFCGFIIYSGYIKVKPKSTEKEAETFAVSDSEVSKLFEEYEESKAADASKGELETTKPADASKGEVETTKSAAASKGEVETTKSAAASKGEVETTKSSNSGKGEAETTK